MKKLGITVILLVSLCAFYGGVTASPICESSNALEYPVISGSSDVYNIINPEIGILSYTDSLNPGEAHVFSTEFSWSEGIQISLSVSWTPTNQTLYAGVYDGATGEYSLAVCTGGSAEPTITIPWTSDHWQIMIASPHENTETITYTLHD
ncbi:hypothetical protein E2N92_00195 [Methanofollis formosanus]|uniref:Uncharacterized protein n=1 Tax=Methanofollis formosanus TaxID=299308 RepID=A0A8G1EE98_9EURY|nr:hypothetical protein [Methanofollis formosanus]QYZ77955.1 hypothetical protein E2N92_00195 [Methanofollis formosanus]